MAGGARNPGQPEGPAPGSRLVFIGGLHRSGTTPLARWLGEHPLVSSFQDTGVHADEGQHLQDVYPPASEHGGPGRFAFRRDSHLTEGSALVSDDSRRRLWEAWAPHWDLTRPVLLEKSPPNLVRTRFLQALFPEAAFVIVVRHPVAVAYATEKWVRSSVPALLRHWARAQDLCLADAQHVRRLAFVRYEDLIADVDGTLASICRFIDVPAFEFDVTVEAGLNTVYLDRWEAAGRGLIQRARRRRLGRRLEPGFRAWGYSMRAPTLEPPGPEVAPRMISAGTMSGLGGSSSAS